jgi:Domain of unknown function (DUF4253)
LSLSRAELEERLTLPNLSQHPHRFGDPVYSFSVPGERAIATWRDLKGPASSLGYWPVVLGERKNLAQLVQWLDSEHAENSAAALERGANLDALQFFALRGKEFSGEPHGEWPASAQPMTEFTLPRPILRPSVFHERVDLGLVSTPNSWEVPAKLSIGGWNECPGPEEHVSVLRYWNRSYGAEFVGYSGDVIELQVSERPGSREEAMKLAHEQYCYCSDIVEQGIGTIENLAAALLVSEVWYFWWD